MLIETLMGALFNLNLYLADIRRRFIGILSVHHSPKYFCEFRNDSPEDLTTVLDEGFLAVNIAQRVAPIIQLKSMKCSKGLFYSLLLVPIHFLVLGVIEIAWTEIT